MTQTETFWGVGGAVGNSHDRRQAAANESVATWCSMVLETIQLKHLLS